MLFRDVNGKRHSLVSTVELRLTSPKGFLDTARPSFAFISFAVCFCLQGKFVSLRQLTYRRLISFGSQLPISSSRYVFCPISYIPHLAKRESNILLSFKPLSFVDQVRMQRWGNYVDVAPKKLNVFFSFCFNFILNSRGDVEVCLVSGRATWVLPGQVNIVFLVFGGALGFFFISPRSFGIVPRRIVWIELPATECPIHFV